MEIMKKGKVWLNTYLKRQGRVSLWLSLFIGGIVCFETATWVMGNTAEISEPRFLISTRDLNIVEPLSIVDFTFRYFSNKPKGGLTDQELHLLNGARLQNPIKKGDVLLLDNLILPKGGRLSQRIPKGMRAYTIQPSNTVPLRPGDKIDVLWTKGGEKDMPISLINGATVLNYLIRGEKVEAVIAVGGHDLLALEKAREYGKLTIALRNPEELNAAETGNAAKKHPFLREQNSRRIEIISEEDK